MNTIVIKPKSKAEQSFITLLLKKMNIDISLVEESEPGYETRKAIKEVHQKKGTRVKDAKDLFARLEI
jgi:hypothetical protein